MRKKQKVWSNLPNAHHIDWVVESVKNNPDLWTAARRVAARAAAWDVAWDVAWVAAWVAARDAARSAARSAAWTAARDTEWGAARDAAWDTACGASLALVAYDHAERYLEMSSNALQVWTTLSEDPAAVLLLPAVIALEKIQESELVS